jgi:hypothetical protein
MNKESYNTLLQESNLDAKSILEKLGYNELSPLELRRIFLLLSRSCFSKVENYNELSGYELTDPPVTYSQDKYAKKINVELEYVYDPEEVNARPSVFVGLGDVQYERQVMGDIMGSSDDHSTTYYAGQSQTQLTVKHISTSPDLCYAMADQTVKFYLAIKPMLEGLPGFADMRLGTISKVRMIDPDKEKNFQVDVIFPIVFMFAWTTRTEDQRLKEIGMPGFGS